MYGALNLPDGAIGYIAKTVNYAITPIDFTVNCIANSFTVTLPSAAGIIGRIFVVKNSGTGTIAINSSGGTIDGVSIRSLIQYESYTLQSDGTNWIIIS